MDRRNFVCQSDQSDALRALMQPVGIHSFRSLAHKSQLSRRVIDSIRQGKIAHLRYEDLVRLSDVLKVSLVELLQRLGLSDGAIPDRCQWQLQTLQYLEPLLLQFPTLAHAIQNNPQLPAKPLVPLFQPIEKLLHHWGITAIAPVGATVTYDPALHELMDGQSNPGDPVMIRYVGYSQGTQLLYRARVSPAPTSQKI
ncbi:MAG: helix-turn-helix domain-containing protein [Oscillatoriales cyanobacterium SM2_2_1]|nr:helix-turn-helix domain-containing protein [Oscillatoriales cyanobacterium SM2_2_1]